MHAPSAAEGERPLLRTETASKNAYPNTKKMAMNQQPNQQSIQQASLPVSASSGLRKAAGPAAGAVIGTSVIVLLVELARSGALAQYSELLAPLLGWGPGLFILMGFFWLAHRYAPPLIESQRSTATALQKLADTVEHNSGNQHDLVLAMQVNSDKLEQVRNTVADLQDHVQQLKEEWRNGLAR